jgi:SAM-dependent methyltransferase
MRSVVRGLLVKYFGLSLFDIKDAFLAWLGFLASLGGRKVNYDSFFIASNQTLRDRLTYIYLNRRYYHASEADKHSMNREKFWGGKAGMRWHEGVGDREKLIEFRNSVRRFAAQLSPATVVEIGCGNGVEIARIADQIDGPRRFVGIDLSVDQIELCRKTKRNPKLEFYASDGVSWIRQNRSIGGGLIVSICALECFTNGELKTFLEASRAGNWAIALFEPIGPLNDYLNFESVPRGNLAYSHNYEALIRSAGYNIVRAERTSSVLRVYDVCVLARCGC